MKYVSLSIQQYNAAVKQFCENDKYDVELFRAVLNSALYDLDAANEAELDCFPCKAVSWTASAFGLVRAFLAKEKLVMYEQEDYGTI